MYKNLRRAALAAFVIFPFTVQAVPLQACFVYVSPVGQAGWSFQHDQGRQAMAQALGAQVQTRFVESVAEGPDSERVMRDLAGQGCGLIVATSFGYLEPALKVAADFPAVKFEHAGGYKTAPNLGTYNARYYEARWLAGYLAGRRSKTGQAGYVAGFPVPEVVQGINAFTLGMRAANPQATVRVSWLNTWFDPAREREAALALIGQGADVLTNHSGSPAVPQTAEEKGVSVIAYQSDMVAFAPHAQLAAVTHHWGSFYTQTAKALIAGQWRPTPVWGGMKDGLVQLSALRADLPAALKSDLEQRRQAIVAGRFKPFSGPLRDNQGRERSAHGALSDEQIAQMDWLVQGVVGTLPAR
ncbi:MAG: BMP family ABC transporter substrate-binding protein [Ideonella sp.]|nr:BMP family ABC transporter substrate-binding protein [Ideonella sp.]MBL0148296.1 BMP family ABC transporter substrate-binding protein [Ideonella sp.]